MMAVGIGRTWTQTGPDGSFYVFEKVTGESFAIVRDGRAIGGFVLSDAQPWLGHHTFTGISGTMLRQMVECFLVARLTRRKIVRALGGQTRVLPDLEQRLRLSVDQRVDLLAILEVMVEEGIIHIKRPTDGTVYVVPLDDRDDATTLRHLADLGPREHEVLL